LRLKSFLILLVFLLVLGGYFFFFNESENPPEKEEPQVFVWNVHMDEIQHIEIQLPREGKSESFIKIRKDDEFPWYFDDPQKSAVDVERWGGGIPLILSGPAAERVIFQDATEEKLAELGLASPQMEIILIMDDGHTLNIKVGDETPEGNSFYVQAPNSNAVSLVDSTWYEVLERLVREPPYVSPELD
jgi:hypothetical protein